jgi:hypothetical protein
MPGKELFIHLDNVFWRIIADVELRVWPLGEVHQGIARGAGNKQAACQLTSCNETLIHASQSTYTEEKRQSRASTEICRQ